MIHSAQEFQRLRTSDLPAEYQRAANEDASIEVWRDIVASMPDMREWVAHNKNVPLEILERLAVDKSSRVRFVVAGKRKLPEKLQLELARDPDAGVRHGLACNAKVTKRALEILAQDKEELVRKRANERIRQAVLPSD